MRVTRHAEKRKTRPREASLLENPVTLRPHQLAVLARPAPMSLFRLAKLRFVLTLSFPGPVFRRSRRSPPRKPAQGTPRSLRAAASKIQHSRSLSSAGMVTARTRLLHPAAACATYARFASLGIARARTARALRAVDATPALLASTLCLQGVSSKPELVGTILILPRCRCCSRCTAPGSPLLLLLLSRDYQSSSTALPSARDCYPIVSSSSSRRT